MISIVISSCLNKPERLQYLNACIDSIVNNITDYELLIGFDRFGIDIPNATCYTHDKGLGHSWNWGIKTSKSNIILQLEDDWVVRSDDMMARIELGTKMIDNGDAFFRFDSMVQDWYAPGCVDLGTSIVKEKNLYNINKCAWDKRKNGYNMYFYSNHPHLKLKNFHDVVGYYVESQPADIVEVDMCDKVLKSNMKGYCLHEFSIQHIGVNSAR